MTATPASYWGFRNSFADDAEDELTGRARRLLENHQGVWKWHCESMWVRLMSIEDELPPQGWKLHISATSRSAQDVLTAVMLLLLREAAPFKFAATCAWVTWLNNSNTSRTASGKFITIYPRDDVQAVRVAEMCDRATEGLIGPAILSDRPVRPGSLVHYRYGAFHSTTVFTNDGDLLDVIHDPDGNPVPDTRRPWFTAAACATNPFAAPALPRDGGGSARPDRAGPPPAVLLDRRYLVREVLKHANKGGVYLATDRTTGDTVVIKEARPRVEAPQPHTDVIDAPVAAEHHEPGRPGPVAHKLRWAPVGPPQRAFTGVQASSVDDSTLVEALEGALDALPGDTPENSSLSIQRTRSTLSGSYSLGATICLSSPAIRPISWRSARKPGRCGNAGGMAGSPASTRSAGRHPKNSNPQAGRISYRWPARFAAHCLPVEEIAVGDMSTFSPCHDQLYHGASQRRCAVDEVLRCCSKESRNDAVVVAPIEYAATAKRQFGSQLAPDRLYDMLSALARRYQVPGAQLAIHHGGETVAVEVGELQYGTGCPVTRDAAFPIGSITKTCTATVAMILVADGDLELDAPLGEYLPELDNDLGNKLTLRQVLSHTGGLAAGPDSDEVLTASIRHYIVDYCRSQNLVLSPGTGFSYSNIGYVLTGHLIETITAMSWWDAMESILLWPLEIEPTFICTTERWPLGRPLATGHSVNTAVNRTRPVKQSLALAEAPAGGLALSAVDLVALGLTQLDGRTPALMPIVQAAQMRQAVFGAEPLGLADGWGLGLAVFRGGNTTWVGHDGNGDGTACYLRVEPANGCAVAFTSNANVGASMWQELVTELPGMGLSIRPYSPIETLGRPTAPPLGCVGTYVNGDTEYSVTIQRDGSYRLTIDGEPLARLTFYDGFIFSQHDLASGRWVHTGRFLQNPVTGDLDRILVGGRVGRRQSPTPENRPCLIAASAMSD